MGDFNLMMNPASNSYVLHALRYCTVVLRQRWDCSELLKLLQVGQAWHGAFLQIWFN